MNFYLVKLLLIATFVSLVICQESKRVENAGDIDQDVEILPKEESNRDKRGFIVAPLSAFPAASFSPFFPQIRSVLPNPSLPKVAAILQPAQVVNDAVGTLEPTGLPAVLAATAPLIANRAALAAVESSSEVTSQKLVSPLLPAAPPTIADAPVVTIARLQRPAVPLIVANQVHSPVVASQRFSSPILPAAPPTVANAPVVSVARAAPIVATNQVVAPVPVSQQLSSPFFGIGPQTAPLVSLSRYAANPYITSNQLAGPLIASPNFLQTPNAVLTANAPLVSSAKYVRPFFPAVNSISAYNPLAAPVVDNNPTIISARILAGPATATIANSPQQVFSVPNVTPVVTPSKLNVPVVVPQADTGVIQPVVPAAQATRIVNSPLITPAAAVPVVNPATISSTYFGVSPRLVKVVTK